MDVPRVTAGFHFRGYSSTEFRANHPRVIPLCTRPPKWASKMKKSNAIDVLFPWLGCFIEGFVPSFHNRYYKLFLTAIFNRYNSYVTVITREYNTIESHGKPRFSYGFPMVFRDGIAVSGPNLSSPSRLFRARSGGTGRPRL